MAQQLNSNLLNLRCLLCRVVRAVMPVRCMGTLLRKVADCLHTPACQQLPASSLDDHALAQSLSPVVVCIYSGLLWPTADI